MIGGCRNPCCGECIWGNTEDRSPLRVCHCQRRDGNCSEETLERMRAILRMSILTSVLVPEIQRSTILRSAADISHLVKAYPTTMDVEWLASA